MDSNLFYTVMEADGDMLEPFDENAPDDNMADQQQGQPPEQPPDMGADSPPDATDMDGFDSFDETGGDMDGNDENGDQNNDQQQKQEKRLSDKANDILNERLYQQFLEKNSDVEETLDNLQSIIPILPNDVVMQNDQSINRLKRALNASQDYVLNKFVNAGYGENLLMYQKFDTLYTLLQNKINSALVKFNKESDNHMQDGTE